MESETEGQAQRNRFRLTIWHVALLCLLSLSVILWFVFRPRPTKFETEALRAAANKSSQSQPPRAAPQRARVPASDLPVSAVRTLSSEKFRARFSARVERREVESVLRTLEKARRDVSRQTTAAAVHAAEPSPLDVLIHDTTGDFVASTGQPWWAAAVTHDNLIELQPLEILRSRGVLDQTLRHEYAHTVIEIVSQGRAPRWLAEGLAAHIAGEGAMLTTGDQTQVKLSIDEIERKLQQPASAEEMRELYAAAYREVSNLIRTEGEAEVWRRLAQN